jgi:hypothetical protein
MVQPVPVKFQGWPRGMDNRRSDFDVNAAYLRSVINGDVLSSGRIRSRAGITQRVASAGAHSVANDGTALYWATANAIKRALPKNFAAATLLTDARLASPLSWVFLNGQGYFSNEAINGVINASGAYEPWGIVPPAAAPALSAMPGARTVQVTCAFVTGTGEISGAPLASSVSCGDNPAITVTAIPQSTDSRVVATRLFVNTGKEFFKEADVPAGLTTWTLLGPFGAGELLDTQFMSQPPPGQLLEQHNGAMYVAQGSTIFSSAALRYNLFDNTDRYYPFSQRVTMMKAVPHGPSRAERPGMFVSADKTYFIEDIGDKEPDIRAVFEYKAIEGAAIHVPNSDDVMWLSERGICRGSSGGKVENLTEDQVAMDQYTRAAMGMLEREGHRAVLAIGQTASTLPLLNSDWTLGEIDRLSELT